MIVGILAAVVAYALLGPAGNFVYNYIGLVFGPATLAAMKAGAVFGAVMGAGGAMISGGSFKDILMGGLKGALFGAISAGVASGIGDVMGHSISFLSEEGTFIEALQKAILHGLSRGVINTAQGGKFGAGFASGFISSGFAVGKSTFESLKGAAVAARTAVMAVVGGVTSEITGGKFANGAITGAFVHLFNSEGGVGKFIDGVKSVKEGLYNFGDYLARVSGFRDWQQGSVLGDFYQEDAIAQTKNTYKMVKFIATNSKARALFVDSAKKYISENPEYVTGRALTGGIVTGVGKFPVAPISVVGDVMFTAKQIDEFAKGVILGQ